MKKEIRERKVRSDKKREIRPTIPVELYECIARLSYIIDMPIKDVGMLICKKGLYTTTVVECLSNHFRRDYWADNNVMYTGNVECSRYVFPKEISKRRITMKFYQSDHDKVARLAYSLDLTVSSATTLLLETSIKHTGVIDALVSRQARKKLDSKRMKQLREVVKF